MVASDPSAPIGQYVQANGLSIYYETYGNGIPLLLLHGGTLNLNSWSPQIVAFSQHFRVIALDSRGHGRTRNPSDTMTYRLLADDTVAFIHALSLDRPFICGYSDGGQIALEMGMHYPHLARGYVMGGACYRWPDTYFAWAKGIGMENPGVVNLEQVERDHPDFVARLRDQQDTFQGPDYWKTYLRHVSIMWLAPLNYTAGDLQQISEPTLIVLGDHDQFVPVEQAVTFYRQIPSAELAIVPGVDHALPWEKADLFAQVILDFLLRYRTATT